MSRGGSTKEELGRKSPPLNIEDFLKNPARYLDGKPYFYTISDENGEIPPESRGPFCSLEGDLVWVVPTSDTHPLMSTGCSKSQTLDHPKCKECIAMCKSIQKFPSLPKIPIKSNGSTKKVVNEAIDLVTREERHELLLRMSSCMRIVSSYLMPLNGRPLRNEITLMDRKLCSLHVYKKTGRQSVVTVPRLCIFYCGAIPEEVVNQVVLADESIREQKGVVVSLGRATPWVEDFVSSPGSRQYYSPGPEDTR